MLTEYSSTFFPSRSLRLPLPRLLLPRIPTSLKSSPPLQKKRRFPKETGARFILDSRFSLLALS